MNIIPFRGVLPNLSLIPDQDDFFESVKENYNQFSKLGYFLPQGDPAFYVFRIQGPGQQATGLVCATHVEDYIRGSILKHEKTIHSKQRTQIDLLLERRAAVKPVLLVHRQEAAIRQWLLDYAGRHQPVLQVNFPEQQSHFLWEVSRQADVEQIRQLFRKKIPVAAIADGHHRLSSFAALWQQFSASEKSPFASVLAAYFPEDELQIAAFHRMVELPAASDPEKIWQQLSNLGTLHRISAPQLPRYKHEMIVVWQARQWYTFEWHRKLLSGISPLLPVLDVDLLDQHIMGPILAVEDVQADSRLHYIEGAEDPLQLERALQTLPTGITFVLHPIRQADFLQVASLGIMLTPKATFFHPRLKNGLVVQAIL